LNNRRILVIALGMGALATPFASFAQQQGKVWRAGFLGYSRRPDPLDSNYIGAFPRGMRELGYVEGKNLTIEWRFADGRADQLPSLAAELVKLKLDVIVTQGPAATRAAQKATAVIPIVMVNSGDPVGQGFVKSLAHPEANITGGSNMVGDLILKHLEMLRSMVPKLSRAALLVNPNSSRAGRTITAEGQRTGVKIIKFEARTQQEIDNVFSSMRSENAGALIVLQDAVFLQQRKQIAELAMKHRLPSISGSREYVEAGGLIGYGTSLADGYLRAATYADKIFKGAKPSDLPVEQPTKFELFINGKTAKALGLKIPQSLLISADKVIE